MVRIKFQYENSNNKGISFMQAPKKKLTKKEKARIEAERAEAARIELEKERYFTRKIS